MDSINPMFNVNEEKYIQSSPKMAQQIKKIRKERSDKKKDVRILLNPGTKRLIKKLAFQYNTYPTVLSTDILTEALHRIKEYDEVDYPIDSEYKVVAKLDKETFEILQEYSIEWDCSIRKAANRVFINSLMKEGHSI